MKIQELADKRIAIWGMGVEGNALISFLKKKFPGKEFAVIEDNKVPESIDVIFKSPGVSAYLPEVLEAEKKGIVFSSLIDLYLDNRPSRTKVIGVTGTKGKSTTVSMLGFMLERMGFSVEIGGNIGVTPLEFIDKDLDYAVLELSSFQIKGLSSEIDIALYTNISSAHLDWHLTLQNYANDKLELVKHAKKFVLNYKDENLRGVEGATFYNHEEGLHVSAGKVMRRNEVIELPDLQVMGEHNLINLCGALSVLDELGLNYKKVVKDLRDFQPLEHRLQKVLEAKGVTFVDDSIATVADSVIAGMKTFEGQDLVLIAGGYDNGSADYAEMNKYIEKAAHVKKAVCLPDTGVLIKTSKSVPVKDMREAVAEALKDFKKGVVLLSPAAPSFNLYKNYKERGKDFARIAEELFK